MSRLSNLGKHARPFSILDSLEHDQKLELTTTLHDSDEYFDLIPVNTDSGLAFLSCSIYDYGRSCTFDVLTPDDAASSCRLRLRDVYSELQDGHDNDCSYVFYNNYSRVVTDRDTSPSEFTSEFLVSFVDTESVRDLDDVISDIEAYENRVIADANKRHDLMTTSGSFSIPGSDDMYRQLFDVFDESMDGNGLWISRFSNERCWTFVPVSVNGETMFCDITNLACGIDEDGLHNWSVDKYLDDDKFVGIDYDSKPKDLISGVFLGSLQNPYGRTDLGEFVSDDSLMATRSSIYFASESGVEFGNTMRFIGDDVMFVSPFIAGRYPDVCLYSYNEVVDILDTQVLSPIENPYADPVEFDDCLTEDFYPDVVCRVQSDGYEQLKWQAVGYDSVALLNSLIASIPTIDLTDVVRDAVLANDMSHDSDWSRLDSFVPAVSGTEQSSPDIIASDLVDDSIDANDLQHDTGDFGE